MIDTLAPARTAKRQMHSVGRFPSEERLATMEWRKNHVSPFVDCNYGCSYGVRCDNAARIVRMVGGSAGRRGPGRVADDSGTQEVGRRAGAGRPEHRCRGP